MPKDNRNVWSKTQLALIKAVKQYPVIYKKRFKKLAALSDCWKAIAEQINLPENACRYRWKHIRNSYVRATRSNSTNSKYLDSNLSFLKSEVECFEQSNIKGAVTEDGEKEKDGNDSTIECIDTTSNDTESSEHDAICITTHVSRDPAELLAPEMPSEHSLDTANQSHLDKETFQPVEFKIDIIESLPLTESLENPDNSETDVFGSPPVEFIETNPIHTTIKRIKVEHPDINDTPFNGDSENLKIFNPDPSQPMHLESSLISNLSNKVVRKPNVIPNFETPTGSCYKDSKTSSLTNFFIDGIKCELLSTPETESPPCKDLKTFLSDFSCYITTKFSLEKQKDIQLKICSLLSKEELDEFEQTQRGKRYF